MAGEIKGVDEYQAMMGLKAESDNRCEERRKRVARSRALDRAHEIRMFEIRMLWQRALFVWGFQLAVFIAVAGLLGASCEGEQSCAPQGINLIFLCALSGLGLLLAYALVQINEGSKFWQANWEYHIDMLEDEFEGKLHKTHLKRVKGEDEKKDESEKKVKNEQIVSVSKVNKHISWFLFWFWAIVFLLFLVLIFLSAPYAVKNCIEIILIAAPVIVGLYCLHFKTRAARKKNNRCHPR